MGCKPPAREPVIVDGKGLTPPEPYMKAVEAFDALEPGREMVFVTDSWRCALLFKVEVERSGKGRVVEEKAENNGELFRIRVVKIRP